MSARHAFSFRLALEITLVLAFFLILTGGFFAQARSGLGSSNPTPSGSAAAEIQATPGASIQAALMAAEMAALTPPFFMVTLPIVQR
jgi:hypothetical protein